MLDTYTNNRDACQSLCVEVDRRESWSKKVLQQSQFLCIRRTYGSWARNRGRNAPRFKAADDGCQ